MDLTDWHELFDGMDREDLQQVHELLGKKLQMPITNVNAAVAYTQLRNRLSERFTPAQVNALREWSPLPANNKKQFAEAFARALDYFVSEGFKVHQPLRDLVLSIVRHSSLFKSQLTFSLIIQSLDSIQVLFKEQHPVACHAGRRFYAEMLNSKDPRDSVVEESE